MVEPTVLPVVRVERLREDAPNIHTLFDGMIVEIERLSTELRASESLKSGYLDEVCRLRAAQGEKDWPAIKNCLLEAAAALETFCLHSERLRPYDNVKDAEQTAKRCRFLAAFGAELVNTNGG